MKIKNKIITLLALIAAVLMYSSTSNAALQANGKSTKTDTIGNWLLNVRRMEATGGTLGLTDTINTTDLTSSASTSNNLDIHMELNTEYGAMAILSASSYGNQNKINSGETTTGNKSGVYINLNNEWVAAGCKELGNNFAQFKNANVKYKNLYATNGYVAKIGDAIGETNRWHGGTAIWDFSEKYGSGLIRAYSNSSVFSYYGGGRNSDPAGYDKTYGSRAVVVIGIGL